MAEPRPLERLWEVPGNLVCADCNAERPDWASINLGVVVCLECSGFHREMGVHISQVRSVKLDTKCWEEDVLAHMCSIGNHAFNRVWEAALPPEFIRPDDFPNHKAVRQAFIVAKYRDRLFFRNNHVHIPLVDTDTDRFPRNQAVVFESNVVKLSGGRSFMGAKWDPRTLRLSECTLTYLNKGQTKGTVPLEGCTISLVENDDYPGHAHCFGVQTTEGSAAQGRKYVFQCETATLAVEWVQKIRFAAGHHSPHHQPRLDYQKTVADQASESPPSTVTLCQISEGLSGEAPQRVASEELKKGRVMALDTPNAQGVWIAHFAVLTSWCFYLFREEGTWGEPIAAIPLQSSELNERAELVPKGKDPERAVDKRFSLSFPLGYVAMGCEKAEEAGAWMEAIRSALDQAQQAR